MKIKRTVKRTNIEPGDVFHYGSRIFMRTFCVGEPDGPTMMGVVDIETGERFFIEAEKYMPCPGQFVKEPV